MIKDINGLVETVVGELRSFSDVAVVGLSGGADSTLVAILSKKAFGAENVWGVHMPYNEIDTAGVKFNSRSSKFATKLGIKSLFAPVQELADEISDAVAHAMAQETEVCSVRHLSQVNLGNARSRARMTVLYGISHHLNEILCKRVRVIGTGNLSEDFIGYDTKGGDALCDIFPIGTLFKSEVYQLLDYFKETGEIDEDHIDRVPSAGLWDGHTDEGELGYSYNEMEPVIKDLLKRQCFDPLEDMQSPIQKFVLNRYIDNKHKHQAPKVTDLQQFCDR